MALELDSTAGYRLYWRGRENRSVVFVDRRVEVKPDIVADARCLPFRSRVFTAIHCEPPHLFRSLTNEQLQQLRVLPHDLTAILKLKRQNHSFPYSIEFLQCHGYWQNQAQWIDFAFHTNMEYSRILKPDGVLYYKIRTALREPETITVDSVRQQYSNFTVAQKLECPSNPSTITYLTLRPRER